MCVYTIYSDPTHPHFWLNCLLNEEEVENLQVFFENKWCMNKKFRPTQINQWYFKKFHLRGTLRITIIKITRQDKQQNQKTTTNFNNIQNSISVCRNN